MKVLEPLWQDLFWLNFGAKFYGAPTMWAFLNVKSAAALANPSQTSSRQLRAAYAQWEELSDQQKSTRASTFEAQYIKMSERQRASAAAGARIRLGVN